MSTSIRIKVRRHFLEVRSCVIIAAIFGVLLGPLIFCAQAQISTGDQETLLAHLNAVINWYKKLTTDVPPGQEPSDAIYSANAQNLGAQVVRLAFQSARAPYFVSLPACTIRSAF